MSEENGNHRWDFFSRGVTQTLDGAGSRRLSALKTVKQSVMQEEQRLLAERPKVFVAMPAYSTTGIHDGAWSGFTGWPSSGENLTVMQCKFSNSLLCRGFNHLWVEGISQMQQSGVTHFAMLHSDVVPDRFWVDTLWEELTRLNADIVSVVIPIKSPSGLTSTALDIGDPWDVHRLTMTEIMQLPETFSAVDVTRAGLNPDGGDLLVNTGCWICDLRKPWVTATDEHDCLQCYFTIHDKVWRESKVNEAGQEEKRWCIAVASEDWNFSRMVQKVSPDAKIYATRKVRVEHKGETGYPNDTAWGQWKEDQDFAERQKLPAPTRIPTPEPTELRREAVPMT